MYYRKYNYANLEKIIATLYIVLLPLRMPSSLAGVASLFSACAIYFDFFLHILGFVLMLISTHGKLQTNQYANMFVKLVVFFELISLIMAFVFYSKLGTVDGDDTFIAIFGPAIYYIHYLVIMFYNIYIFGMFTKEELSKIIDKLIIWTLILGYVQLLICNGVGIVASVYDRINFLGVFRPASYITNISRIPISGAEPASAGCLIGIFVFPYLMSKIISRENVRKYYIQILMWLPVIFFTKSSTCFILVFVDLLIFIIIGIKTGCFGKGSLVMLFLVALGMIVMTIVTTEDLKSIPIIEQVRYLLFEKSGDRNNESAVTRTIPTYINFQIFLEYPLTGVGNGNQGFFYSEYFPSWGSISANTFNRITGVADGGVFIPSLFSGYGIIGVLAFVICTMRYLRKAINDRAKLQSFYYMFRISFIAFLVNGFQSDYFGNYITMFVLCIPFMAEQYDRKYLAT